jgi:hypothetical protein
VGFLPRFERKALQCPFSPFLDHIKHFKKKLPRKRGEGMDLKEYTQVNGQYLRQIVQIFWGNYLKTNHIKIPQSTVTV